MKGKFVIDEPFLVKATLTLTMTLDEWERLKNDLAHSGRSPSWELQRLIEKLHREIKTIVTDELKMKEEL